MSNRQCVRVKDESLNEPCVGSACIRPCKEGVEYHLNLVKGETQNEFLEKLKSVFISRKATPTRKRSGA